MLKLFVALAEEFDIPVGIHKGEGRRAGLTRLTRASAAALGRPLLLEEVLIRRPKLRIYVMHAGWPLIASQWTRAIRTRG
jgi:uncharacterized protein